jgi:pantoate kinase
MTEDYNLKIVENRINYAMESLNKAVEVCQKVENESISFEQSYPYATGYAYSSMQSALEDLKFVKDLLTHS